MRARAAGAGLAAVSFGTADAMRMSTGDGSSPAQDFTIRPLHVHVNLIGFVGYLILGAFYHFCPAVPRRGRSGCLS